MKTKDELEEAIKDTIKGHKEIIFGSDTPICMACLDELRKQQAIDQHVYDQKLMDDTIRKLEWDELQKNIVMDSDTMIDKRTREFLSPEVDSTYWKDKSLFYSLYRPYSYMPYGGGDSNFKWVPEEFTNCHKKYYLPSFRPC